MPKIDCNFGKQTSLPRTDLFLTKYGYFKNITFLRYMGIYLIDIVMTGRHDIWSRDVDTHRTAGPQVQSRSVSYGKSHARFSAGSNPKRGDPTEK
jgi:hypothetical protein